MNKEKLNKLLRRFGFEVHGLGYLQSQQKREFKEDAFEKQKSILHDRQVEVIFDIGANRGQVTQQYLDLFPNATIYAFEPFEDSYLFLKDRFKDVGRVHCIQQAIANETDTKELHVNANVDTNSLYESAKTGFNSDKQVKNVSVQSVQTIRVDEFCKTEGIDRIDILKLDIQGGELNALKGAGQLLINKSVGLVYTEAYFFEQYKNQPLFFEIGIYLHNNSYCLQDIYNPYYGNGRFAWCDAIFIPYS